jgi:adenylate cyclase
MRPAEFRGLMGRFYDGAFAALIDFNAIVDKFVGDEVIGIFIPAYSGQEHARHAVDAARRLLEVTGHDRTGGPWIPIGIGVHSGVAFVGSVGQGPDTELTAMGDAVNVTARLAAAAGPGEILVTAGAAAVAGGVVGREHRSLQLKGKSGPTDVVVLTIGEAR